MVTASIKTFFFSFYIPHREIRSIENKHQKEFIFHKTRRLKKANKLKILVSLSNATDSGQSHGGNMGAGQGVLRRPISGRSHSTGKKTLPDGEGSNMLKRSTYEQG